MGEKGGRTNEVPSLCHSLNKTKPVPGTQNLIRKMHFFLMNKNNQLGTEKSKANIPQTQAISEISDASHRF